MMNKDTVQMSGVVRDLLKRWIDPGLPKSDLKALIAALRELADLLEQKLPQAK